MTLCGYLQPTLYWLAKEQRTLSEYSDILSLQPGKIISLYIQRQKAPVFPLRSQRLLWRGNILEVHFTPG